MTIQFGLSQPNLTREITTLAGDNLPAIASRHLGDPTRFREIADLNPGFNPNATNADLDVPDILQELPSRLGLQIPTLQSLSRELPIFDKIAQTTTRYRSLISQGQDFIGQAQGILGELPIPEGYTKAAQEALGEINGVFTQAETVLDQVSQPENLLRKYAGQVQLVDWLLL